MKYLIFDSFWYDGLKAKSGVSKLGQQALEERRKQNSSDNPDILNLLFNAKTDNGQPLPEKDIVSDACAVMAGSADAPSIVMAHFIDCITRDMRVQYRIQEEIDNLSPGTLDEGCTVSDSVVQDLPFLGAALKESQRLISTSSTGLERVVPQGGRKIVGEFLPGGTLVSVPTPVVSLLSTTIAFTRAPMTTSQIAGWQRTHPRSQRTSTRLAWVNDHVLGAILRGWK